MGWRGFARKFHEKERITVKTAVLRDVTGFQVW